VSTTVCLSVSTTHSSASNTGTSSGVSGKVNG
jgi:hypothetical protein